MKVIFLILVILMACIIAIAFYDKGEIYGGSEIKSSTGNNYIKYIPLEEIRKILKKQNNYGPITQQEELELCESFPNIDKNDLVQIRDLEVTIAACKSGVRAMQNEKEIKRLYSNGIDILTIAKKLHLPPASVSKQLGIPLTDEIRAHDLSAGKKNIKNNVGNGVDLNNQADKSAAYERFVEKKLADIKFKTEDMIKADKSSILTPDYLFEEPVYFEGNRIYWADAKHYPLYNASFHGRLLKQVKKYTNAFGPGLLIFSRILQPVDLGCYLLEIKPDSSMLMGSEGSRGI